MTIFDEINETIQAEKQNQAPRRTSTHYQDGAKLDVVQYLTDNCRDILKQKPAPGGGTMFCLDGCVFDPNHGPNEAAIIQADSGLLTYQCFHESCKGRTWADARRYISGDEKLGRWMVGGNGQGRPEANNAMPAAEGKQAPGIPSDEILHALGRGEDGDAELFVKSHLGRFCYDHAARRWYEFSGHYWRLDRTEKAMAAVSTVIELYAAEAGRQAELKHKALVEARKEEAARHGALESEILKRIGKLHGRQRKENILTLAAAGDGSLGITGLEWDADPWVIGCPNGVVDLKTGELRQGKPTDYIKTVANIEWSGIGTPCPAWERFVAEVFDGDTDIMTYIQILLGYALIGDTFLHIIPILWGRGRNGKGTLLEIVKHILGPYAFKAEAEMLLDQKSAKAPNAHNSGILALQGKRIVWTSEVDEGRRFNAAKVKELVGGDTLSGRAAYGRDHLEFRPSHLLLLLTNTKPAANPSDYALWQRIHLIEFGISFVENPTDPKERPADLKLAEKLKAEGPGVLAWMVRGCLRFNQEGLRVPDQVRAAVARYREEEDILGGFIAERCIEQDAAETPKGALYQAYKAWCEDNGHAALGGKRFYPQMDDRFDSYQNGRHLVYIGVGIREG